MALGIGKPVTAAHIEIGRSSKHSVSLPRPTGRYPAACCRWTLTGLARSSWLHAAPADRCRRRGHPVQLSARSRGPPGRSGAGRRLRDRSQAPERRSAHRSIADRGALGVGAAGRVAVGRGRQRPEIGDVFVEDHRVRAITFTGSSKVGWELRARAPRKRVALERVTPPLIVCADADLEAAGQVAAATGFGFAASRASRSTCARRGQRV